MTSLTTEFIQSFWWKGEEREMVCATLWAMWGRRRRVRTTKRKPTKHYVAHKEYARGYITERVERYAETNAFQYKRIAIRNTRRSWGSCSELGNLNFSYKLIFLPEHIAEYIIVHELCHLRELNHSPQFWAHVSEIIPDYKERKKALRHIERLPPASLYRLKSKLS